MFEQHFATIRMCDLVVKGSTGIGHGKQQMNVTVDELVVFNQIAKEAHPVAFCPSQRVGPGQPMISIFASWSCDHGQVERDVVDLRQKSLPVLSVKLFHMKMSPARVKISEVCKCISREHCFYCQSCVLSQSTHSYAQTHAYLYTTNPTHIHYRLSCG